MQTWSALIIIKFVEANSKNYPNLHGSWMDYLVNHLKSYEMIDIDIDLLKLFRIHDNQITSYFIRVNDHHIVCFADPMATIVKFWPLIQNSNLSDCLNYYLNNYFTFLKLWLTSCQTVRNNGFKYRETSLKRKVKIDSWNIILWKVTIKFIRSEFQIN